MTRSLSVTTISLLSTSRNDMAYWFRTSMKVAPASSAPRMRRMTTEFRDVSDTAGICSSSIGAVAKKMAPYGWRTTTSSDGTSSGGSTSSTRPSSWNFMRLVTSRDDWRPTNRMTERPTPTSTAYWSGMISVRTKVTDMTASGSGPVLATDMI